MRRADAGLTLLEVLGAVALLGILYTVLAGAATQGVRSEGDSRRRLEASLLADAQLAEIETQLAAGVIPAVSYDEAEFEGFTVIKQVSAFEPPAELASALAETGAESLFAPGVPGAEPAVRTVEISVEWGEDEAASRVVRTTYVFDAAGLASLAAPPSEAPLEDEE